MVLVPLARWGVVSSPWGPPVEGLYNHPTTSPARSNTSFMSGDLIMNLFSNEHSQKQLRNSQLCTLTCKCRWFDPTCVFYLVMLLHPSKVKRHHQIVLGSFHIIHVSIQLSLKCDLFRIARNLVYVWGMVR